MRGIQPAGFGDHHHGGQSNHGLMESRAGFCAPQLELS
jgi:hypothetical protein